MICSESQRPSIVASAASASHHLGRGASAKAFGIHDLKKSELDLNKSKSINDDELLNTIG